MEKLIQTIYSEFDTDISVSVNKGKTFNESEVNWLELSKIDGIKSYSRAVEEIVVLRHEKKWVSATLVGVENSFLEAIEVNKKYKNGEFAHLIIGEGVIQESKNRQGLGLIGAGLMQKLNLYLGSTHERASILVYAPKRNVKIRPGKTPFYTDRIFIAGSINYNREVNDEKVIWPLENARNLLRYDKELTHIHIDVDQNSGHNNEEVKIKIQTALGPHFKVKTNYEKNELIYQTSKSERLVVIVILIFIFILASFNLIASLTMLFFEKKENMTTLKVMGVTDDSVFRIFLYEGLLISGSGMLIGLFLGYLVCFIQSTFQLVVIRTDPFTPFPIAFSWGDFFIIFLSVAGLSFLFSYFPVRVLIRNARN